MCVYLPHHQTSSVPACKQMSETTITIQKIATCTCACSCRLGKSSLYKSLELDHQLCLEIILHVHVYPAQLHMHAACTHTPVLSCWISAFKSLHCPIRGTKFKLGLQYVMILVCTCRLPGHLCCGTIYRCSVSYLLDYDSSQCA